MLNRKEQPLFRKPEIFHIPSATRHTLSNGIPYFEYLKGSQEALRIEIVFNAGSFNESLPGLSLFTTKLLSSGTKKYSANAIEEAFASFGAFLELNSGFDHSSITVYCLRKHVDSILDLVKELLINPVFPIEELENLKNVQVQTLRVNQEKTSYLATTGFRKHFFSNHSYSNCLTEESILKINRENIIEYYNKYYGSENISLFISGGSDTSLHPLVEKYLSFLKNGIGIPERTEVEIFGKGSQKVFKNGVLQNSIRYGLPGLNINHEDYPKLSLLNEIFGGYFGSRLMKNIREDKGYTYGIHSSLISLMSASYLVIGTDIKSEVSDNTLAEIVKEMRILKDELVSNDELETVKNYMIGSFINSVNSPFAIMDRFKITYFHNLHEEFYFDFYNNLLNVTSHQLKEMAQVSFIEDKALVIVAGV